MRVSMKFAVALLGLGLTMAPAFVPSVRAEDAPKEKPKQNEGGPNGGGQRRGNPLDGYHKAVYDLDLTSEQKTKLDPLFADAKTKMEAAQKDAAGDRQAAREKTRPIMEDLRAKVGEILTAEQKEKLAKSMPQRRPGGGPGGGQGGNGGAGGGAGADKK